MAESPADIESGPHRLQSLSRSEMVDYIDTRLRSFAFNLALIEKAASTLGTMNFIWATVVLLGGFSQSLKSIDFWFVSIILVVEGLRILCRRGELAIRLSLSSYFSFSNFTLFDRIFFNPNLQLIHLYSLGIQEYSGIACIVLSSLRIHEQQYGSDHNPNRIRALNLFYWLSTVESSMTLVVFVVRFSLSYQPDSPFPVSGEKMLSVVVRKHFYSALEDDGFDYSQLSVFQRYFCDAYSRCINGNVFDGLKMDFVSYSVELLQSIDHNDQLAGARLLSVLLKLDSLHSEKLRVIRTMPGVLERLIELLNWEKPKEREIRTVAGEIICKLVQIPGNRIRVMAIPESMESITSLLYDSDQMPIHSSEQGQSAARYDYRAFSMLGKRILKSLAKDPDNHAKIVTNRGLRSKIIALGLNSDALEADIIWHLERMETETETLADQQDVRQNIEGTNGFLAERSDAPNLQSVDSQV